MTGQAVADASTAAEEKFFATNGAEIPADDQAVSTADVDPPSESAEAPKDDKAKPEGEDKAKRMVPHGALHEERERRKQAEKRAERVEELFQRFMTERGQPKAEEKGPEIPAFDQDPANHLRVKQETAEQRLARLENERQAEAQITRLRQHVGAIEAEFAAKAPDYQEAVNFLQARKVAQYERSGMTRAEAINATANDAMMFTHAVLQRGLNPAEQAYELAKDWGYSAKKAADVVKPEEKLETIRKGQDAAKGGGGSVPEAPASLKSLADMDPRDPNFDKEWDRLVRRR